MNSSECKGIIMNYFIYIILIILLVTFKEGSFALGEEGGDDEMWEGESDSPWVEENVNVDPKKKNETKESPRIYPTQKDKGPEIDEEMMKKLPKMHPEDETSYYMPEYYWCDGCRIVAYQIVTTLEKAHKKRPSIVRFSEVDLIDILEGLCEEGFEEYGLVEFNGINRLVGPGLETDDSTAYRLQGGKWPNRLRVMCGEYLGDVGELPIYNHYIKDKDLFTSYLCQGPGVRNKCGEINYNRGKEDL